MGKSGGAKQKVADYYMSIHFRMCHAPLDALLGIYIGEKIAWSGNMTAGGEIPIYQPSLFGGVKKEGGAVGLVRYLPGGPSQVMPNDLAARMGLTSATCPGYRALASLFFRGSGGTFGSRGFLWSSNNPYLKSVWAKGRRKPRGINQSIGLIGVDANPAHIIYECLTDTDWGQGGAPSGIDTASFETAAQTLYNEGFGLSLMWTKQADIESFVSEILDHIQATLYVNPRNGLMTIKLIRDDYVIDDLPVLNADNSKITQFDRKAWGETVNEVVVTWTNPENEQEETLAAQNNANIAIQGGIISDSRNYYGVRSRELAQKLAFRDLATASAPLAVFEIEADRSAWDFVPGGCARVQYPEYGIDDVVVRILKIDYGKPGAPAIKLSATEDIFAIANADYDPADGTNWEDPSADPEAAAFARIMTAPAFFVVQSLSAADVDALQYPEVLAAPLVSQDNDDTHSFDLYGVTSLPNGDVVSDLFGTRSTLGHAIVPVALPAEPTTLVEDFGPAIGGPGPVPGGFVFIGNVNEYGHEIALIDSFDETGWTLKRGVLDTVPRAWPDGTVCWFVSVDSEIVLNGYTYSAEETINVKVAPATSRGVLSFDTAPVLAAALTGRPHLPLRPANVTVAGAAFGSTDLSASPPSSITVTWENRNRTMEDSQVLSWTAGNVTPEPGQTTTVKVFSAEGGLLKQVAGLTGTSYALTVSDIPESVVDVAVHSVRDGLESLQGHRIRVKIRPGGWGDNWGEDWGAGDGGDPGDPTDPTPGDPTPDPTFPPPPTCTVYGTPIWLANATLDGPGPWVPVETIRIGDHIWTRHARTGEWGVYCVIDVVHAAQDVYRAEGYPDATPLHRFLIDDQWTAIRDIGAPAGRASVVRLSVYDAETYANMAPNCAVVISHNRKARGIER